VPGSELAERTAALLSLAAATEERSLSQLTLLAASQVAGCAAADVTLWRDGELANQAASHPDAARLVSVQLGCGRGPVIDAIDADAPISCHDTMTETRWPEFAAAALRTGVRNSVTLSYRGPVVIVLTLFGVRPGAVSPDQLQLAELLVAYGGGLVGAVADYGSSQRTAVQLRDAATGRAVVDQAKGILMHALGCTADEALDRMRDVSQRSNVRATEVARRIVAAHSGRRSEAARDDLAALAGLARRGTKSAR
jgi:ANTAR domain